MTTPWYRQFWPWFLIALPAASVCAGIATVLIAAADPDGLVVSDYYRVGRAINQDLARRRAAEQRGLSGEFSADPDAGTVRVTLSLPLPGLDEVSLRLVHPTRARFDLDTTLYRDASGALSGTLRLPGDGRRQVVVEPADRAWRLTGRLGPARRQVALTPG